MYVQVAEGLRKDRHARAVQGRLRFGLQPLDLREMDITRCPHLLES